MKTIISKDIRRYPSITERKLQNINSKGVARVFDTLKDYQPLKNGYEEAIDFEDMKEQTEKTNCDVIYRVSSFGGRSRFFVRKV